MREPTHIALRLAEQSVKMINWNTMCSHFCGALSLHPLKTNLAPSRNSARSLVHIGVLWTIHDAIFTLGKLGYLASQFLYFNVKNLATLIELLFPRSMLFDGEKVIGSIRSHISKSKNGGPINPPFCTFTPTRPYLEKF